MQLFFPVQILQRILHDLRHFQNFSTPIERHALARLVCFFKSVLARFKSALARFHSVSRDFSRAPNDRLLVVINSRRYT